MGRLNPKQLVIRDVEQLLLALLVTETSPHDREITHLVSLYHRALVSSRYIFRAPHYLNRKRDFHRQIHGHHWQNANDFCKQFRVEHDEFADILGLIEDHPIFISTGNRPQAAPFYQLTVALFRLSHEGHSCNAFQIGHEFGISEGTSMLWTERVIIALLEIEEAVVYWPETKERRAISAGFTEMGIPGGCVGIVSSFLVVLANAPARHDYSDFFSYKKRYGFNVLSICDHNKRIIFLFCGWAGSAHDSRVFNSCDLACQPARHFADHEYLLADSAYPPSQHMVPVFKGNAKEGRLPPPQTAFNIEVASKRVLIEHTYGLLKGRWSSLRGL